MPLKHMPDLCLIVVFKLMPLNDQMSASKVSARWCFLVRTANRSLLSLNIISGGDNADLAAFLFRINTLSIGSKPSMRLLTKGGQPLYPLTRFTNWNSLLFGEQHNMLDTPTVEQVVCLFPSVSELTFVVYSNMDYCHLIDMLTHNNWNMQLNKLTLVDHYKSRISPEMSPILFATINTLPALKHLALSLFDHCQLYDLPVVAQLEEVAVDVYDKVLPSFLQSLERYASLNYDLKVHLRSDSTEALFKLSAHLRNRIIRFCNTKLGYSSNNVPFLCANFCYLTTLSIYSHTTKILKNLFAGLTQLAHLIHLDVSVDFRYENETVHHLAELPSVKALDLQLFITSHEQVKGLNLSSALSNLETLHLHYFWCTACDSSHISVDDLRGSKVENALKCLRMTLSDLHSGVPLNQITVEEIPTTADKLFAQ